jgi:RimJ/RimL family protein N-acetyltransferase
MAFPLPLETDRLVLRRLTLDDAAFIVELLNEESFRRYIGDTGVRDSEDARGYLRDGPLASYERLGASG